MRWQIIFGILLFNSFNVQATEVLGFDRLRCGDLQNIPSIYFELKDKETSPQIVYRNSSVDCRYFDVSNGGEIIVFAVNASHSEKTDLRFASIHPDGTNFKLYSQSAQFKQSINFSGIDRIVYPNTEMTAFAAAPKGNGFYFVTVDSWQVDRTKDLAPRTSIWFQAIDPSIKSTKVTSDIGIYDLDPSADGETIFYLRHGGSRFVSDQNMQIRTDEEMVSFAVAQSKITNVAKTAFGNNGYLYPAMRIIHTGDDNSPAVLTGNRETIGNFSTEVIKYHFDSPLNFNKYRCHLTDYTPTGRVYSRPWIFFVDKKIVYSNHDSNDPWFCDVN